MKSLYSICLFFIHILTCTYSYNQDRNTSNSGKYSIIIHDLHAIAKQLDMFLSLKKYHDYLQYRSAFFLTTQRLINESYQLLYIYNQNPLTHSMNEILQILNTHTIHFSKPPQSLEELNVLTLLINDYISYSNLFDIYNYNEYEIMQDTITYIINILDISHPAMQQLYNHEKHLLKEYKTSYENLLKNKQHLIESYAQHFTDQQKLMLIIQATDEYQLLSEQLKQWENYIKNKIYEIEHFDNIIMTIKTQIIAISKNL